MYIQGLTRGENDIASLYLRCSGEISLSDGVVSMSKGAVIGTDTYFNACSVGKWFAYCDIKAVILKIRYSGRVKIEVLYADYDADGGYGQDLLVCEELSSDTDNDFEYRIEPVYSGVVYYRISALSDGARLLDS